VKARRVKQLDPAGRLDANAARLIGVRLDELQGFAPEALREEQTMAQHDMRIAAKRLRYVLEVTGFCFGAPAEVARRRARELQDILGELHDCDVMLPRVERHLPLLKEDESLDALTDHLRARRSEELERFRRFWARQEETGTWLRLRRALDATPPPRARRPAPRPAA
jgi:CHAD domain-containing protein